MTRRFNRVAVLLGGWSAEREVSLVSGAACAKGLRAEGYDVVEIDATRQIARQLEDAGVEAVFNALHGRWGEDGCVQGIMEVMGLPYTHSGVLASSLAMDKVHTKAVCAAAGLPVVADVTVAVADLPKGHPMEPPYVLKPINEGSSVGVLIVERGANGVPRDLPPAIAEAERVMAEQFVAGKELTVAVMDGRALAVTDILPAEGFYDYKAKYAPGGSRHQVPADIPAAVTERCLRGAEAAHAALGCRGVSRTDFRYDPDSGVLAMLEVNTQPGMTPTSLVPEQAEYRGMNFRQLVAWIMEDASCSR